MPSNDLFINYLPVSVRSQIGRLSSGLECFGSLKIDGKTEATVVPVLFLSGTI
jgi:hypothetical protein